MLQDFQASVGQAEDDVEKMIKEVRQKQKEKANLTQMSSSPVFSLAGIPDNS